MLACLKAERMPLTEGSLLLAWMRTCCKLGRRVRPSRRLLTKSWSIHVIDKLRVTPLRVKDSVKS